MMMLVLVIPGAALCIPFYCFSKFLWLSLLKNKKMCEIFLTFEIIITFKQWMNAMIPLDFWRAWFHRMFSLNQSIDCSSTSIHSFFTPNLKKLLFLPLFSFFLPCFPFLSDDIPFFFLLRIFFVFHSIKNWMNSKQCPIQMGSRFGLKFVCFGKITFFLIIIFKG